MKMHLKDYPYIDYWNEDSIEEVLKREFKSSKDITEDIDLYQNQCETMKSYKLRTISKNEAIFLFERYSL